MRISDHNLLRFARAVHWRLVFARAVERGGACAGVASAFACILAVVALVQGRDAMPLVLATLALGAMVGIIWGFSTRPTRFDAICEADRQLKLSDLLATAYAQRGGDDAWQRMIVALADDRCRSLSPAAVVVHRYGGRAWGGIGLSAALGLTLALLSGVPRDSRARTVDGRIAATANKVEQPTQSRDEITAAPSASADGVPTPDPTSSESRASALADPDDSHASSSATSDNRITRAGDNGSGGQRAGQTSASGDAVPRGTSDGREASTSATASPASGGAATASAAARADDAASASAGNTVSRGSHANAKSPPWSSSSWSADRAAAGDAVRAGRVPDAYRDVVGEYFRDRRDDNGRAR